VHTVSFLLDQHSFLEQYSRTSQKKRTFGDNWNRCPSCGSTTNGIKAMTPTLPHSLLIQTEGVSLTLCQFHDASTCYQKHAHRAYTTATTIVLQPFFRDHLGEPVPEENFWTLWCKGRLTEADTQTIRLGATPSGLTSAPPPPSQHFLQAGCPSCRPTNSVKALKATSAFG